MQIVKNHLSTCVQTDTTHSSSMCLDELVVTPLTFSLIHSKAVIQCKKVLDRSGRERKEAAQTTVYVVFVQSPLLQFQDLFSTVVSY